MQKVVNLLVMFNQRFQHSNRLTKSFYEVFGPWTMGNSLIGRHGAVGMKRRKTQNASRGALGTKKRKWNGVACTSRVKRPRAIAAGIPHAWSSYTHAVLLCATYVARLVRICSGCGTREANCTHLLWCASCVRYRKQIGVDLPSRVVVTLRLCV